MKKQTMIIAAIAATALSFTAQATTTLTGSLGFDGSASIGGQTWPNLTYVTVTGASIDNTANNSYAGLVGDTATFNNPVELAIANYSADNGGLGTLLFSVVDASGNIWGFFDLATTASGYSSAFNQYQVAGTGVIGEWNSNGSVMLGESAVGGWNADVSNSGTSFAFAGTGLSTIPDSGTTMTLLGGSLLALQAIRRKLVR